MKTTAVIDADYLVYSVGFGKADETEENCLAALDETLYSILEAVQADYHLLFISDNVHDFRSDLEPSYKANRKGKPRPEHYEALREHLTGVWCAEVTDYMEADDACSLANVNTDDHETVLVHVDKDLNQIPGMHFNPKRWEFYAVSKYQAMLAFYSQMLTGDSVDNIKGVKGIGPKTTYKLFNGCTTEQALFEVVDRHYSDKEYMLTTARLLWLLTNDRTNLIFKTYGTEHERQGGTLGQAVPVSGSADVSNADRGEQMA